jgi:hypothetical protein
MASAQPGPRPEGRDPDVLTAAELAARLGVRDVQTLRDAMASGDIPAGRPGHEWLASWRAVYEWLAGPGVPDGDVVDAAKLGRLLGISARLVLRSAGPPGTPGRIWGRQVGKRWRFAVEAARLSIAGLRPQGPQAPPQARAGGTGPGGGSPQAGSAGSEGGPGPG